MKQRLLVAVGACALLLSDGCAPSQVLDMGNGRHSLVATAPSGGFYGSHEEGVEQANHFCERTGQQAVIDGFYDHSELGPQGEHTSSVLFRCAAPPTLHF